MNLKKLNFKTFAKNANEMYDLLEQNRTRLSPWFWWADEKVTPTKFRFYTFMTLYLIDTRRKKIAHKFNSSKPYDEQFFVYNENSKLAGMIGLDDIDITDKKAEIWGLAFKGNNQTLESIKILENYCINTLNLDSIYGKVQSTNRACRLFWEKYGYDKKIIENNVRISKHNPNIADMYTYVKVLTK